ncbi:MAG: hypothetical protein K6E18_08055 [Lachnospiraceae bacterium]|nr:hypothetical protein [Lachnospiraceae bacterium]
MFEMANKVDDDFDKNEIKQSCKDLLAQNSTQFGVSKKDFLKAANMIVADTLLSPAFDKTFFDSDKVKRGGFSDITKLNKAVIDLREQIVHDPIFQDVINSRPTYKNFVSRYKDAVRKEVNKKINNEKSLKEVGKRKDSEVAQYEKYAKENTAEIQEGEFERIKETRLSAVEKLTFTTDKIVNRCRDKFVQNHVAKVQNPVMK